MSKQAELNQLDRRIKELQQNLKIKKTSNSTVNEMMISSNGLKNTTTTTIQDTLNNINLTEIEQRMIHIKNSFKDVNVDQSSITAQYDQINGYNNQQKVILQLLF